MAEETKNIIQLKESTSGPTFYPETHKAAIVGKEDYVYLGEVVSPGGGGGGTTGSGALSVSQRKGVIVNRAIPKNPRKGKKYYFADGIIKVKMESPINHGDTYDQIYCYDSQWQDITEETPIGKNYGSPCVVTILEEGQFSIQNCSVLDVSEDYCSQTESPNLIVEEGRIVNVQIPHVYLNKLNNYVSCVQWANSVRKLINLRKSGKLIFCFYKRRGACAKRISAGRKMHYRGYSTKKIFNQNHRFCGQSKYAIVTYRRHHRSALHFSLRFKYLGNNMTKFLFWNR